MLWDRSCPNSNVHPSGGRGRDPAHQCFTSRQQPASAYLSFDMLMAPQHKLMVAQQSGPVRLQQSGPIRLQQSGPIRLQHSGPIILQQSGPIRLQQSGPIILQLTPLDLCRDCSIRRGHSWKMAHHTLTSHGRVLTQPVAPLVATS